MSNQDGQVEEVHAPNGGEVDTVNLDLLRGSEGSSMVNMHHDRLSLDRREGMVQIGAPTPDMLCYGGWHYRRNDGVQQIVRVQAPGTGEASYLYKGTGGNWSAGVSSGIAAGVPDQIGNGRGNGNGTFVQYADRLYWHDGGTFHRWWDGALLHEYGRYGGVELPAGTATASDGSAGGGTAYSFTFAGATSIQVGIAGMVGAGDYTITGWCKTSSVATQGVFVGTDAAGSGFKANALLVGGSGTNRGIHEMYEDPFYARAVTATSFANGNWHHIGGRRSGNQGSFFLDGGPTETRVFRTTPLSFTVAYLGATRYGAGLLQYFTGQLDDLRFYTRALSDAEFVRLSLGLELDDATGLVGWWKFDEGSGVVITDSSGQGNHGTITGAAAWSQDVPDALVGGGGTGSAAGDLQAGDYSFVYTYFNPATAEESPPSAPSNTVTFGVANGALNATVPASALWSATYGFTSIRFYRTVVDGATYFFDHQVDNVAALPITEVLSKKDELLGAEVDFSWGAIPRMRFTILFNEMVVGCGDPTNPSAVYWSEIGDPMHWPPENAQDIDKDNGDPITGIFRLLGRLYILKETSGVYMLTPQFGSDGTISFAVDAVTNDWGCLSHHAIVVIDTFAFWPDAKGIVKFNGQQCQNVSDPKIRNRWKFLAGQLGIESFSTIPRQAAYVQGLKSPAKQCVAVHDRQPDHQYYRLTIQDWTGAPTGPANAFDLVYDTSIGCWFENVGPRVTWNSFGPRTSWLVKDVTGQYAVFQADDSGRCFRLRTDMAGNVVYDDAGWPINSTWKSRFWGGMNGVLPLYVELEYERSVPGETSGPITINLYADGQTTPRVTDSTSVVLYDINSPQPAAPDSTLPDPTRKSHSVRVNFDAEWCRRFCFEVVVTQTHADLKILWYRIGYQGQGGMLKAM